MSDSDNEESVIYLSDDPSFRRQLAWAYVDQFRSSIPHLQYFTDGQGLYRTEGEYNWQPAKPDVPLVAVSQCFAGWGPETPEPEDWRRLIGEERWLKWEQSLREEGDYGPDQLLDPRDVASHGTDYDGEDYVELLEAYYEEIIELGVDDVLDEVSLDEDEEEDGWWNAGWDEQWDSPAESHGAQYPSSWRHSA